MSQLRMPQGDTHVAMSSWIAVAGLCGWKFRLGLVFGVPGSGGLGSLAGLYVHKVLARSGGAIERVWASRGSQSEIATRLDREIEPIRGETLGEWKRDLEDRFELVDFEAQELIAGARLHGMIEGLAQYMVGRSPPDRILTELQITNTTAHQEGRVDAIFEWPDHYSTVDFKTYSDDEPRSNGYDHLQIVSNGMLANYRYGRPELDFTNNELLVVYTGGIYLPRATDRMIEKVVAARSYVLGCLTPDRVQTITQEACYRCERPEACGYYKDVERLHRSGQLPESEEELRRRIWHRRYAVLDFRQISHRNKFIVSLNDLPTLEKFKILETGYSMRARTSDGKAVLLTKKGGSRAFLDGDLIRVIGVEKDKPTLACVSFNGSVVTANNDGIEVTLSEHTASDASRQLTGLPVAVMRTEIDLTRRELQALDYIQRRAPTQIREIAQALLGED